MGGHSTSSSTWTINQNKAFEQAMAIYDNNTPDRWHKIASMVGGKSAQEVRAHYQVLIQDLNSIESGKVPFPKYAASSNHAASKPRPD